MSRTLIRFVALLAALCGGNVLAQDAGDDVVAKLGSTEVRVAELKRLIESQPKEVRDQLLASAPAMDRLVRTEVFRRALLAEAKAKGWERRPDVAAQIDRARDQVLLSSYVNEITRPPADYPSEQDVVAAYNANQAEFAVPRQFRVSQIFVAVAKDAPKADAERLRKKADEVAKRAPAKDADFARLAQANSDHKPSAEQGGDLGWLAERDMIPEIRAVIPQLAKGEVSKPVRTEQGWHIVKLIDIKAQSVRPLAEVKPQLVQALRQRRAQEMEKKYLDELADKNQLGVNEIALGKLRGAADKP
ncbi:MAG: peptidylprolyl isomerase [Betaproteobacteria bacterium]